MQRGTLIPGKRAFFQKTTDWKPGKLKKRRDCFHKLEIVEQDFDSLSVSGYLENESLVANSIERDIAKRQTPNAF